MPFQSCAKESYTKHWYNLLLQYAQQVRNLSSSHLDFQSIVCLFKAVQKRATLNTDIIFSCNMHNKLGIWVLLILIFSLLYAFSKLCNHISCSLLVSHLSIYFVYHSYLSSYFCFVCLLLLSFFLFPVWSPFKQLFLYCTYNLHKLPQWALAPGANVTNKYCLNK